jgi:hypothetical protein
MKAMEGKMDPNAGPDGAAYPDSDPDIYPDGDPGIYPDGDPDSVGHGDVEKGFSASTKTVTRDKDKLDLTRAHWVLTPDKTNSLANGKLPGKLSGKLPGGPWDYRHGREFINLVQRGVGIFGAIIFVGPTILMVLVKGTLCRLLTSSLCTVAFAIGLSFWTRSAYDLVTGTAAYAAVLTVFVGATS